MQTKSIIKLNFTCIENIGGNSFAVVEPDGGKNFKNVERRKSDKQANR